MKTIKKITLLVSMVLLSCAAVFAQDLPDFENENAFVFDAATISGKFKDNIVIINKNDAEDLEVKLFGYKDSGVLGARPLGEGVVEKKKGAVVELVETTVPFFFGAWGRLSPPCYLRIGLRLYQVH